MTAGPLIDTTFTQCTRKRVREKSGSLLTAHHSGAIWASDSVRIVAVLGETLLVSSKGETIGTGLHDGFSVVTFVVVVTVLFVWVQSTLSGLAQLLRIRACSRLSESCQGERRKKANIRRRTSQLGDSI